MNKKQAIKHRLAAQPPNQEIHAATILKGNLVNTLPPISHSRSLEEQIITNHEKSIDLHKQHIDALSQIIENLDRIIEARDGYILILEKHVQEWKDVVLRNEKRREGILDELEEGLVSRCAEKYAKLMVEERGRYRAVIERLEGRIEELEGGRRGGREAAGEERGVGGVDCGTSGGGEGKLKAVGNERGKEGGMDGGWCVVS